MPPKPPTPPSPINYNYTRTPGPLSADQMIAQQQERMRMQSQQATPRDHMQYQQAAGFNAESMSRMGMANQMPQMPRPGPQQMASMGFGAMPQPPFRQYPEFNQMQGGMFPPEFQRGPGPMMPTTPAPKRGFYGPDFADMTDADFNEMYQKLYQAGAFNDETLQGY